LDEKAPDHLYKPLDRAVVVAALALVPIVVVSVGFWLLLAVGVESHKALSLAGLAAVSVAGAWGLAMALLKLDLKILGRTERSDEGGSDR
jgi:uncharacterized membrane protein